MQIKVGKLDYGNIRDDQWKFFTGNSYVNVKGQLTMGRGTALCVKQLWPDVPRILGDRVESFPTTDEGIKYGLIPIEEKRLGVFQVKYNYNEKARLSLIDYSGKLLRDFADIHHDYEIHMNFPGIGYGGLSYGTVKRKLEKLNFPSNVVLWT